MPFLRIETNIAVASEATGRLLSAASDCVAEALGKPVDYVMACVEPDRRMMFAGSDAPAARLELDSIGLGEGETAEISRKLCAFVTDNLNIPSERIFIVFNSVARKMWGWNATTF